MIEKLFKIQDKRGISRRFIFNPAQSYYWEKRKRRNIILKARQKGLSKVVDADQAMDCMRKPTNAVVISHEKEATKRLFRAVKYFMGNLEYKPMMSTDNRSELVFPKTNSYFYIGTAGQRAFGRGDTISRAHLSEFAFYQYPKLILTGVSEAAEYGQIDIESTANGRGNYFHDIWEEAKNGKSSYTPIFIPWFIDKEYSSNNLTDEEKEGLSPTIQELFEIPDDQLDLTPDEKELVYRVDKDWGIKLDGGQIKWRRYKMWDRGDMFWQEYPEDDVSCFLQSGRPVFKNVIFKESLRGEMKVGQRYYAGIDGAEGILGGDNHCFAVIDANSKPAKVVYEICSNEPIEIFANRVKAKMNKYDIILGVEKNGVGYAHCLKLKSLGVQYQEWETTSASRPVMITQLEEAYRKGYLVETYLEAKNELLDMAYNDNNRAEHRQGKHDDRVFARAIAWQMRSAPVPGVVIV